MNFDSTKKEIDDYYSNYYAEVHSNGTLGFANSVMHSRLERKRTGMFNKVLELGCGNFEHLPFVSHDYILYVATDIRVPPQTYLDRFLTNEKGNFFQVEDALNLSFPDHTFDRIVAGCLIVHLTDVALAMREWQRVSKPDGVVDFVVPCDPGLLLRVFRRLVSIPNAKKYGVSKQTYERVNAIEHVSSFSRTLRILRGEIESGRKLKIRYYPFPWLKSWNFNAFAVVSIQGTSI